MVRIQKILCPVDFFPASNSAAEYAIGLAKNYSARLILLHVVSPVVPSAYEVSINVGELMEDMSRRATVQLKKLARRAEAQQVPVEVVVRTGEIDREIQSMVEGSKADFIVMGTHGRRGLEKFFIGSVTERMLRQVHVPLLTIGSTKGRVAPPNIRQILLTTDFSEGTVDAVSYAFSIAQECQAEVTLMHVLNDVDANISGRYRDQLIRSIRTELENLIPEGARDWCEVTTRVESGRPAECILPVLKNEKIDLLVMNIHGKTLLDRVMIGKTAESIVRASVTPVLVVPPMAAGQTTRRISKKKP